MRLSRARTQNAVTVVLALAGILVFASCQEAVDEQESMFASARVVADSANALWWASQSAKASAAAHPATPDPSELSRVDESALPSGSAGPAASVAAKEIPLFTNENADGVTAGITNPATFTVASGSVRLLSITTYHYMYPKGLETTGTIGLIAPDGSVLGPWRTVGSDGQGGVPNALWRATVDVTLPAGTYTISDSSPATWSSNSTSGDAGIFWTTGYRIP